MGTTNDLNHLSCKESLLTGSQHPAGCGMLMELWHSRIQESRGSWIHVEPAPEQALMSEHFCTAAILFVSK